MPSFKSTTVALLLSFAGGARGDYSYGAPTVNNPLAQKPGGANNSVSPDVGKLTGGQVPAVQPTAACPPTGGQGVQGCTFVRDGSNYGYVVETSQYNGEPHNIMSNGPKGAAQAPAAPVAQPPKRDLLGEMPEGVAVESKEAPLLLNGCVTLPDGKLECSVTTPGFVPPPQTQTKARRQSLTPAEEHVLGVTGPSMEPAIVAQGPSGGLFSTHATPASASASVSSAPVPVVTTLPVAADPPSDVGKGHANHAAHRHHATAVSTTQLPSKPSPSNSTETIPHVDAFPISAPGAVDVTAPIVPAHTAPPSGSSMSISHPVPTSIDASFPSLVGGMRQHGPATLGTPSNTSQRVPKDEEHSAGTVAAGSVRGDVGVATLAVSGPNYAVDCVTVTTAEGEQVPLNCAGHGVWPKPGAVEQGHNMAGGDIDDANRLGMGGRPASGFHRSSPLTHQYAENGTALEASGNGTESDAANRLGVGGRPGPGFHRSSPLTRIVADGQGQDAAPTPALRGAANNDGGI